MLPGLIPPMSQFYQAVAVNFDGTNDYLTRGATLTGAADSKLFTFFTWLNPSSSAATQRIVGCYNAVGGAAGNLIFRVTRTTTGAISLIGNNAAAAAILSISSSAGAAPVGSWTSIAVSCDMANTGNRYLLINGVNDLATVTTYTNDTLDFTGLDWAVGAEASGANKYAGDMSNTALRLGTYMTDVQMKAAFLNGNEPNDPGLYGFTPILGLSNPLATWQTNTGSGGGMTVTGALTAATSFPP